MMSLTFQNVIQKNEAKLIPCSKELLFYMDRQNMEVLQSQNNFCIFSGWNSLVVEV